MDEYRKYEPIFGSWKINKLIGEGSYGNQPIFSLNAFFTVLAAFS